MSFGTTNDDLVSIVIPCYNGERFLAEAIESVLRQSYSALELIVVDDASPDNCEGIARFHATQDVRVQVHVLPRNRGVAGAFNAGFAKARGQYMTRLAQDDIFAENAIERMVKSLNVHDRLGLVYCNEKQIDENGRFICEVPKPSPDIALACGKIGVGIMWRREVWQAAGCFDSSYDTAEDYEFCTRVARHAPIIHINEALVYQRIHPGMGSVVFAERQEILGAMVRCRALKSISARRRYMAKAYLDLGFNQRKDRRFLRSVGYLLRGIWQWPFHGKCYRCLAGLIRDMVG